MEKPRLATSRSPTTRSWSVSLKMVPAADFYTYDEENKGLGLTKPATREYMKGLVDAGGAAENRRHRCSSRPDAKATALSMGIYYTPELTRHLIEQASETAIVQEQLNYPTIDVFNGKEFTEEEESGSDFSMENLFSIDEEALQNAFKFDESKLNMDTSALGEGMSASDLPAMPGLDAKCVEPGCDLRLQQRRHGRDDGRGAGRLHDSRRRLCPGRGVGHAAGLPDAGAVDAGVLRPKARAAGHYGAVRGADRRRQRPAEGDGDEDLRSLESSMKAYMEQVMATITAKTQASVQKVMGDMAASIPLAMSVDTGAFQNAFQMKMTEDELTELIMSLMTNGTRSFDANLSKLGYAELSKPSQIDIYPDNFEDKQQVIAILDDYNDRMVASGQDDKKVSYTDFVGTLMKSVTTIVDMISYVLIAFVAISLVVSSIMIGIITYISVLERKKEIGILRAIGASKGDISRVFNAETIIEGLTARALSAWGSWRSCAFRSTPLCTGFWTCRDRHAAAGGGRSSWPSACSCRLSPACSRDGRRPQRPG
ncbi:MAG: ABC transporter permease [Adlercreutzia equolifaciens]